MALNLKTLATRSLSGAVFVVLLIGSLLFNYYTFSAFFFIVAMLALNEFYKMAGHLGAKPYQLSGFVLGIGIYVLALRFDFVFLNPAYKHRYLQAILILSTFIITTVALFNKRENPILNTLYTLMGLVYAVLPFALLHSLVITENTMEQVIRYQPEALLGVIFLIWSNDTFAYLGGSLFGKHKMIPRISPGKTWEGTLFGILVTFGISFLVKNYLVQGEGALWPLLGILVPVMATVGDLVESMLKRQAGVKDSGNIMPGHGGALDRFDSLIFVTPFVVVLFYFL